MRTKPYTERGIRRVPCFRCGEPSVHQWQICSDGNQYRGMCLACDILLNGLILEFLGDPDREAKMLAYTLEALGEE